MTCTCVNGVLCDECRADLALLTRYCDPYAALADLAAQSRARCDCGHPFISHETPGTECVECDCGWYAATEEDRAKLAAALAEVLAL